MLYLAGRDKGDSFGGVNALGAKGAKALGAKGGKGEKKGVSNLQGKLQV